MNKDTVVASVIGFSLGLVAAIALWVVPRIIPKTAPTPSDKQVLSETSENNSPVPMSTFEITTPKDGDIIKTNTITVKGRAPEASVVIVTTPTETKVAALETNGDFALDLTLAEGVNEIVVVAASASKQQSQLVSVYYFTEGI